MKRLFISLIFASSLVTLARSNPPRMGFFTPNKSLDSQKRGFSPTPYWEVQEGALLVGPKSQNSIVALALPTFESQWELKTDSSLASYPLSVPGGWILPLRNGKILKIDGATRKTVWELTLSNFVIGTPLLLDNLLVLETANHVVSAIDVGTQEIIWSVNLESAHSVEDLLLDNPFTPAADERFVYVRDSRGYVVVIDYLVGRVMSQVGSEGRSQSRFHGVVGDIALTPSKDIVFCNYDGRVHMVAEKDLARSVEFTLSSNIRDAIAFENYFVVGTDAGQVFVYDTKLRRLLVQHDLKFRISRLQLIGDKLFVGGERGDLVAMNFKNLLVDGARLSSLVLWRDFLEGPIKRRPMVVTHGNSQVLLAVTGLNNFYFFKL